MRSVKFTTLSPPYNAGEVAGFPDEHAARLVAAGHASYTDNGSEKAAAVEAARVEAEKQKREAAEARELLPGEKEEVQRASVSRTSPPPRKK